MKWSVLIYCYKRATRLSWSLQHINLTFEMVKRQFADQTSPPECHVLFSCILLNFLFYFYMVSVNKEKGNEEQIRTENKWGRGGERWNKEIVKLEFQPKYLEAEEDWGVKIKLVKEYKVESNM